MFINTTQTATAIRHSVLAIAAALLTATGGANASANNDICKRLDQFIDPFVEMAMFDGIVMAELRGKRTICRYGFADYENGLRHKDDTQFRIASISQNNDGCGGGAAGSARNAVHGSTHCAVSA